MKTIYKSTKNSGVLKGIITAQLHEQNNPFLRAFNNILKNLEKSNLITRETLFKFYKKGKLVEQKTNQNVICVAGINTVVDRLVGEAIGSGEITQVALGDGVGVVSENDTAMFNEVYRNNRAGKSKEPKTAVIVAFFTEDEIDGTFTEFGTFVAGVDMWTHVNINWTKPDTQSLTVQCTYTINNA